MSDPILHYLIVFNHKTSEPEILEFGQDIDAALVSYAAKEKEFFDDRFVEIVLVGSDSLESVRATHSNYFPNERVASGWLVGLGPE